MGKARGLTPGAPRADHGLTRGVLSPYNPQQVSPPAAGRAQVGGPAQERVPPGCSTYEFTIPGDVVPWARAGSKGKIRFTPKKQADYMVAVKLTCSAAMKGKPPLEGPIMLDMTATYPWPASMSQKKRSQPAAQWRTARPDIDNIAKLIGDALNRIAWADDSQIACSTLRKVYGDVPGLLVKFGEIHD